jgi:hypothetical protein
MSLINVERSPKQGERKMWLASLVMPALVERNRSTGTTLITDEAIDQGLSARGKTASAAIRNLLDRLSGSAWGK